MAFVLAAVAGGGIVLGRRLDPTSGDRGQSVAWRRFRGSPTPPGVVGAALPAFTAVDQDGRRITEREFHGNPWITDFIYTRCQGVCPLLTARMVALQRALPAPGLRFVSFSVDPEHDRSPVLKSYADRWHGDPGRWRLLGTDATTLDRLVAAVGGPAEADAPGSGAIVHSDRFTLVDASGRIRGSYDSADPDELSRLQDDEAGLERGPPEARPQRGQAPGTP